MLTASGPAGGLTKACTCTGVPARRHPSRPRFLPAPVADYAPGTMQAIERVLLALEEAGVRYVVVGGVAVVLHGHLRTTAGLDLVVGLDPDNARAAVAALAALGYRPRVPVDAGQLADAGARRRWVDEKGLTVLSFWSDELPELEVDVFVTEPFDFAGVLARAPRVALDEVETTVIGLDDLIALKTAAGRPNDLSDVEALRALRDAEDGDGTG